MDAEPRPEILTRAEHDWRRMHMLDQSVEKALAEDQFDLAVSRVNEMEDIWHRWDSYASGDTDYPPTDIIDHAKISIVEAVARRLNIHAVVTPSPYAFGQLRALNDKLARDRSC